MKTHKIVIISIILCVSIFVGVLLIGYAGLMYIGDKMFEQGWTLAESIKGPDGFTYCIMHETGVLLDPHTKLIRTKNLKDEASYEDLGSTNEMSSWLPVIRPSNNPTTKGDLFYLPTNDVMYGVSYFDKVYFIYDIDTHQYYEGFEEGEMSPFILIEDANTKLHKPDIFPVLYRVVREYDWPSPEALKEGVEHPNEDVRKLSKWIMAIREEGLSSDSETINECISFLINNKDIKDDYAQDCIMKTLGYFKDSSIEEAK